MEKTIIYDYPPLSFLSRINTLSLSRSTGKRVQPFFPPFYCNLTKPPLNISSHSAPTLPRCTCTFGPHLSSLPPNFPLFPYIPHRNMASLKTPTLKNPSLSLSSKSRLPSALFASSPNTLCFSRSQPERSFLVITASAASFSNKPTVLVAEKLGEAGLTLLNQFANVDCSYNLSPEELCTKISLCDALIVRSGTKVNREVFESSGGRLKVVGRAGVGIDNVDLAAATEHGCLVVNAPTANTVAAAEHGIALLAAMARNVAQADASVKAGEN